MTNRKPGFTTRQVHSGVEPDPVTGAILTPIYQTTTYVQESVDRYLEKGYSYSRSANPTVRALEKKLTDLEGGVDTICFGTGMAAVNGLFMAYLSAGDHAVVSDVVYGGTYRLGTKIFTRFGVEFSFVDTSDAANVRKALRKNTKLVLTETPANPTLKLTDLRAVSEVTRQHGILHAVDNTFMTPYCQRPLELGADMVVHSTTKYFDGHNATVGGAIVVGTEEQNKAIRFIMNATGMIMSPQVAWLTLQGCKTLSVRMDRQSANALEIARFLEKHPAVAKVSYPGLPSFPQHELAKRQASGFGAMVSFEVKGGVAAGKALMDRIRLWTLAENLGSVESLITHPVTMTHADVEPAERQRIGLTDGLVRLSVGLEDAADLIDALREALGAS
jgi:cystathionine beta-lyase/cystathionine gamma-synthase